MWTCRSSNDGELKVRDVVVRELTAGDKEIVPQDFCEARYKPMEKLLAEDDFLFLENQKGYEPWMGKKLRRERRRIFRLYLRALARDFRCLHAQAREIVASLPAEHSSMVGLLVRQQVSFWSAMAMIELRLKLAPLGFVKVDARGLVASIANMHAEVGRLAAVAAA